MSKGLKFVNGDIVRNFTNTGYAYVEDKEKCRQDVKMVLSTDARESTGIGAGLDATIGTDVENAVAPFLLFPAAIEFQKKVRQGINNLKKAQRLYQYRQRPDTELIDRFSTVQVIPHQDDPRNYDWRIEVYTVDYTSSFPISGSLVQ